MTFCCIKSDVLWAKNVPSEVVLTGRTWKDRFTAFVFFCIFISQLVLASVMIGSTDPSVCGLISEEGQNLLYGGLQDVGFGQMMEEYVEMFIGLMFIILFLAFLYLVALMFFAKVVTWATLAVDVALMILIAVFFGYFFESVEMVAFLVVLNLAFCAYLGFIRKRVFDAAEMLQNAAFCLKENPTLLATNFFLMLMLGGYMTLVFAGMISSFFIYDCVDLPLGTNGTYAGQQPSDLIWAKWATDSRYFLSWTMVWTFFTMNMLRSYIASGTAAMWIWHRDEINMKPCKAAGWALTFNFGTMGIAGLLMTFMDWVSRSTKDICTNISCCCNPCWWILRIIVYVATDYFNALTRTTLVFTSITGEDFYTSAQRSLFNLKGKFAKLFLIDSTAKLVLNTAALVLSVSVALMAFGFGNTKVIEVYTFLKSDGVLDISRGIIFDEDYQNNADSVEINTINIMMFVLAVILINYPLAAILITTFLSAWVAWGTGYAYLFAVFVGALANYMFHYFAGSILDIVGALFIIGIIDKKNGQRPLTEDVPFGSPAYVMFHIQNQLADINDTTTTIHATGPATGTAIQMSPLAQAAAQIACGQCNTNLSTAGFKVGQQIQCPTCHAILAVPAAAVMATAVQASSPPLYADAPLQQAKPL